ncbi:darcynin family protein [Cronobacter muytjensii]|uniref:Darcynin n=1 Tax=Cronobacter muytjensii TaxID=413501 RepID=A0A2T7AWQ2_9ENTR|nr:darcynin family protein [Cronobacter muytjensii]EGT4340860.1 darcynin [Cronobacter muytjensii]ELY4665205.1 darcynin [Cronobacter muytjensii]KAB0884746.1 darcynin [Cronobacter muytjensii]MBF4813451.1 darcynin [Cronobacter muytjensii]PUX16669.1 darcynin [Cronobacter muytjensii]
MNRAATESVTLFMLVKANRSWLSASADERQRNIATFLSPLLAQYRGALTLRYFDTEFYSARISDIWIWEAASHPVWQAFSEALRDTPFWNDFFEIKEILQGVEAQHL